jgi:hypothetical protein
MLGSIKLQFDSHRDKYGSSSIWSNQFTIPYILFILAWHPNTHFNLYLHTFSLINSMQSDFLNLCLYKQTKVETVTAKIRTSDRRLELLTFTGFNCEQCPLLFDLCLVCPHLCTLDPFSNPWSRLVHYPTLLVHAKQATIETNPKSSTHVSFSICQICLLTHDVMISHNIEAISLILFVLLSFAWTRLFPWSSNTTIHNFGLHLNTMWNTTKFAYLLNLDILVNTQATSLCNRLNFLFQHLANLLDL